MSGSPHGAHSAQPSTHHEEKDLGMEYLDKYYADVNYTHNKHKKVLSKHLSKLSENETIDDVTLKNWHETTDSALKHTLLTQRYKVKEPSGEIQDLMLRFNLKFQDLKKILEPFSDGHGKIYVTDDTVEAIKRAAVQKAHSTIYQDFAEKLQTLDESQLDKVAKTFYKNMDRMLDLTLYSKQKTFTDKFGQLTNDIQRHLDQKATEYVGRRPGYTPSQAPTYDIGTGKQVAGGHASGHAPAKGGGHH